MDKVMPSGPKSLDSFSYGKGKWWENTIQSYQSMATVLRGQHLEQNHLVHAVFFRKGPPETKHLARFVPCLTLSQAEHRGAKYSYHMMKDGQRVDLSSGPFEGCGMDAYLKSKGIDPRKGTFTRHQVSLAIDACADYWRMIGLNFAAQALEEFKQKMFDNKSCHLSTKLASAGKD